MAFPVLVRGEAPPGLQVEYSETSQRLGITAKNTPLKDVLSSVNKLTGVEFFLPRYLNPSVTLSFEDMPLERGLEQVFRQVFGSEKNAAMVYVAETGSDGKTRHVLAEVRVVKGEAAGPKTSRSASSSSAASSAPATAPRQTLTPEQLAEKRAEKAAKRAEKEKARAEKQADKRAAKNNRGGGSRGKSGVQTESSGVTTGGTEFTAGGQGGGGASRGGRK